MNAAQLVGGGGIKPSLISGALTPATTSNTVNSNNAVSSGGGTVVALNVVTANALLTVLSLLGRGAISLLALGVGSTASQTHRCKITLDGVVVFDQTSGTTVSVVLSMNVIGSVARTEGSGVLATYEPLLFDTSLLIEYTSSIVTPSNLAVYKYYAR